jgi:hypothetical protein
MFRSVFPSIKQVTVSVWHMPVAVCTVLNSWWWTGRPSETCRVVCRNKRIWETGASGWFTTEIYYDARTYERQIRMSVRRLEGNRRTNVGGGKATAKGGRSRGRRCIWFLCLASVQSVAVSWYCDNVDNFHQVYQMKGLVSFRPAVRSPVFGVHVLSSKPLKRFRAVYYGRWSLILRIVQWRFMILINALWTGIIKPKRHLFAGCVLSGVNCSFEWWNDRWMMDYVGYSERRTWITFKNHPWIFHEGLRKTTQDMCDLRFLQQYCWDSMSSGMWRRVVG